MAANSTLITDYFGKGLLAARPASPNVPSGCLAFYYATDTVALYAWNGAAWVQVTGVASPTIVQTAAAVGGTAITQIVFGSAPTNGNLLIALAATNGSSNAAAGWTKGPIVDSGGTDFGILYWKIAGAAESTTQTPLASSELGFLLGYEINGGVVESQLAANDTSGASPSVTFTPMQSGGLLIGFFENTTDTTVANTFSGATADATSATTTSRSIQGFTKTGVVAGANAVSAAFGASKAFKGNCWHIH